jgi:hypothetical protein
MISKIVPIELVDKVCKRTKSKLQLYKIEKNKINPPKTNPYFTFLKCSKWPLLTC